MKRTKKREGEGELFLKSSGAYDVISLAFHRVRLSIDLKLLITWSDLPAMFTSNQQKSPNSRNFRNKKVLVFNFQKSDRFHTAFKSLGCSPQWPVTSYCLQSTHCMMHIVLQCASIFSGHNATHLANPGKETTYLFLSVRISLPVTLPATAILRMHRLMGDSLNAGNFALS